MKELLNHKILIWGYGLEGKAALNFLLKNNYKQEILVADLRDIADKIDNVKFIKEGEIFNYNFDFVIKTSGVSLYKEEILKIKKNNICISSILNILLSELQGKNVKTIAITGTKGKTTTCSILYHLLKENNFKVALLGNIGVDFLSILDNVENFDYLVLELSSYQTSNILYNVDYGIILNLFPEHIDWHLTHKNYYKDKLNLLNYSKNKIINFENKTIQKYIENNYKDFLFYNKEDSFHIEGGICFDGKTQIFDTKNFENIKGEHIFKNICSILTVMKIEKLNILDIIKKLKDFHTLEHRLEIFFQDKEKNIVFVNDSIATIPEATIESLRTFTHKYENVKLILGGFDRQQDFKELIQYISTQKNKIKVFLIGETGKRILNLIENSEFFDSYEKLVRRIKLELTNNTIVLLSPASASYDMFKNFEERGKKFKELMLNN